MVERALERGDDRPQRGVVVAQQRHHLLRLGALGKGGEAAQVAEHDDDLAAMAFEGCFHLLGISLGIALGIALGNNQLGQLRGDARFELAVPTRDFVGAGTQLREQPRVVGRDHRLPRDILQPGNLLAGKRPADRRGDAQDQLAKPIEPGGAGVAQDNADVGLPRAALD